MAIYKVSRLSLHFDGSTGRMQALRTRPAGFRLPLSEAESYFGLPTPSSDYQVGSKVDTMQSPLGELTSMELLVISTHWAHLDEGVTRTFRTPKRALAQKVEIFDFRYHLNTRQPTSSVLLRFANYVWHESFEDRFQVQTVHYRFHATVTTTENSQWSIEGLTNSGEATLSVKSTGESELLVSFVVLSEERQAQDSTVNLIPVPLDEFTYLLTALTPCIRVAPLSREPHFGLAIPSPPLYYMSSESRVKALYQQGNFLKRLWNRFNRNEPSFALPPGHFMLGDLARMSDILIYNWRADVPDVLPSIISYLRSLGEDRLASLQRILVIFEDDTGTEYFNNLKSKVGEIQLARLQPSTPTECSLEQRIFIHELSNLRRTLCTLDTEFERLKWEPPFETREAFRRAFDFGKPLPPVSIPATGRPAESAPFLAAARLRGSAITIGAHDANADTWPLPLKG